jgi:hypothetical protein
MNRLLSLLMPMAAKGVGKVRVGCDGDGGYVMLDDFRNINSCYSVGIGPEVSWDLDMARRGLRVFQYDHTVKEPPVKHDKFIFTPLGLSTVDDGERRTLATLVPFDVAPSILKIDIGGAVSIVRRQMCLVDFSRSSVSFIILITSLSCHRGGSAPNVCLNCWR